MRFPKPKDDLIQVRVAHGEKRHLVEIARNAGLTLSEFVRQTTTEASRRLAQ